MVVNGGVVSGVLNVSSNDVSIGLVVLGQKVYE